MQLSGVLFFPVTPFDAEGRLDLDALEAHVARGVAAGPGGVFVACGTGELHALSRDEHAEIVRRTVAVVDGRVPVVAGAGGPVGHALDLACTADEVGADGLLLLPPYLVAAPQQGLVAYVREVATSTALPLIAYSRGNAVLMPESVRELARIPTLIGLKDGHGDLELLAAIQAAVGEVRNDFLYFNGLPTAEFSMLDYRRLGVELYSSAVFAFSPEIALAFWAALSAGDDARVEVLLDAFYRPLVALRDEVPGYAVSLVKAGAELCGQRVGPVRPPLTMPTDEHAVRLRELIAAGLEVAASTGIAVAS